MKKIIIVLSTLCTVACAADTDLETAFCDGLEAPAARTVMATTTSEGAPDVTDAARIDIELSADGGFVSYRPDEAGSFAFGLTHDVGLVIRDAAGAEVPIDTTVTGSAQCDALAVRHTATLGVATYTIELMATDALTVGIIAEESDDDL